MKLFECCKGCVAPKRYPGCQDHCIDGIIEKAFSNVLREERRQESKTIGGAYDQNQRNIRSAVRKHNRKVT